MGESLLKTRNVFLDTEAYDHQKLRFDHAALKKLRELGSVSFLHILVTETVDGEVRQHINTNLNNALVALGRFQTHAGVIQAAPADERAAILQSIDAPKLMQLGIKVWETFLAEAKVEIVSASDVRAPELLSLYFAQQPPFSEKKKSEFPDAISLLSLEQWCRSKGVQLYLIGDDPDMEAWCNARAGMYHIKSLKDFLDLYNRAEEKLAQLAITIFEREQEWIASVIEESFSECGFNYAGNWEAEVENVEIASTRIDDVDIIEVDERRFVLTVEMEISFTADVSGPDYDRGWWDSEDKRYLFLPSFHTEISSTETYEVSFELAYDIAKEEATEVSDVMFDDGREITIRDEHGFPHK